MQRLQAEGASFFFLLYAASLLIPVLFPNAVPKRDLVAAAVGTALIIFVRASKYEEGQARLTVTTLERTKLYSIFLQVLSLNEVVATLIIPWFMLIREALSSARDDGNGSSSSAAMAYLLAPHLFVFQQQIGLEGVIMRLKDESRRTLGMFRYTCVANTYRGLAIATWVSRTRKTRVADEILGAASTSTTTTSSITALLIRYLPVYAAFLWFCSNAFVAFIWYPCLVTKNKRS